MASSHDTQTAAQRHATTADLRARATDWLADTGYPGAAVALVDRGETVLATGLGDRRVDPAAPAGTDTRFPLGSATKPVTALGVLALVERGDLSLDAPVGEHFPPLAGAPGDPVTVRELLSHTGGFPQDDVATMLLADRAFGVEVGRPLPDRAAFETCVADTADRRVPDDDRFRYYNSGYAALGAVVESVTGTAFPDAIAETVLDPLGMNGATFDTDVVDTATGATTYRAGEEGLQAAGLVDHVAFRPPGGLLASAADLDALLAALTTGDLPVGPALWEEMTTPAATVERTFDGAERRYGLGWFLEPFDGDRLVGHSGDAGVGAAYVGHLADRGLGVAVACNASTPDSPETLARELLAVASGRDPARVVADRGAERAAAAVEGRYEGPAGIHRATVEWTGDGLVVDYENPFDGDRSAYAPASPAPDETRFVRVEADADVDSVEFFPDATPTALELGWSRLDRVGDRPADDGQTEAEDDDR